MRKPTKGIGENEDAVADQMIITAQLIRAFVFSSTVPLSNREFQPSIFCDCTGRFVSNQFENHVEFLMTQLLY